MAQRSFRVRKRLLELTLGFGLVNARSFGLFLCAADLWMKQAPRYGLRRTSHFYIKPSIVWWSTALTAYVNIWAHFFHQIWRLSNEERIKSGKKILLRLGIAKNEQKRKLRELKVSLSSFEEVRTYLCVLLPCNQAAFASNLFIWDIY